MDIDPQYEDLVHTDASALLRPEDRAEGHVRRARTRARRRAGGQARAGRSRSPTRCPTSTPTRSSPRSTPTRATTSRCWSNGARRRDSSGRGNDLREVFRRFEPTHRDLARFATAGRRRAASNLRHLIHSLHVLNGELARKGRSSAELDRLLVGGLPLVRERGRELEPAIGRPARRPARRRPRRSQGRDASPTCSARRRSDLRPPSTRSTAPTARSQPVRQRSGADSAKPDPAVRARRAPARARPAPAAAATSPRPRPT